MTTMTDLINRTNMGCHLLSLKSTRDFMAKHPDADWVIDYEYKYNGLTGVYSARNAVLVGSVCIEVDSYDMCDVNADIRDIATEVGSTHWEYRHTITTKSKNGDTAIKLEIVAIQRLAEDEKQTLRDLGKLQTICYQPCSYETVVCSR